MRRRSRTLTALILGAAAVVVLGGLAVSLKREPAFYSAARAADPARDPLAAAEVFTRLGDLKNDVRREREWGGAFTADELNAFLAEYASEGGLLDLLPDGSDDPRVAIDGDRIRIGARQRVAGSDVLSAVVSVELRTWMVGEENTVAVEFCDMRLGGLPVRAQPWLDKITEVAHGWNVDVTWYRHEGHPVGLFRLYANQARPTTRVRAVAIADGRLTVAGRTQTDTDPR